MSADWVARHTNTNLQNSISGIRQKLNSMEFDQSLTMVSLSLLKEDEVFHKALALHAEEFKRKVCTSAGICPTCGEKLEETQEKEKGLFRDDRYFTVCSQNREHYCEENYYENHDY